MNLRARIVNAVKVGSLSGVRTFTTVGTLGSFVGYIQATNAGNEVRSNLMQEYQCALVRINRYLSVYNCTNDADAMLIANARTDARAEALTNFFSQSAFPIIWGASTFAATLAGGIYGFMVLPNQQISLPQSAPILEPVFHLEDQLKMKNWDGDCPDALRDPVYLSLMDNPYTLNCGHTVDQQSINNLHDCLMCRAPITHYVENKKLKEVINAYYKAAENLLDSKMVNEVSEEKSNKKQSLPELSNKPIWQAAIETVKGLNHPLLLSCGDSIDMQEFQKLINEKTEKVECPCCHQTIDKNFSPVNYKLDEVIKEFNTEKIVVNVISKEGKPSLSSSNIFRKDEKHYDEQQKVNFSFRNGF